MQWAGFRSARVSSSRALHAAFGPLRAVGAGAQASNTGTLGAAPPPVAPQLSREQARKREARKLAQKRAKARIPASQDPLCMKVQDALRFLRASEAGRPRNQQTLSLTTQVVSEKGAAALNGSVSFPRPLRETRVAVFGTDQVKLESLKSEYRLHVVGGEELVSSIRDGKVPVDFDRAFASPDIVPLLNSQLARILGPKGVLPSIKKGTVSENLDSLLRASLSSMPFKQKNNCVSLAIGKCSFTDKEILQNIIAVRDGLRMALSRQGAKKPSILGRTVLSSTHGPGIVIDLT